MIMSSLNTKTLKKQVAPFENSTVKESIWQIINTIVPFIVLWSLAYISMSVSPWLALVPIVLAAGFLVSIFIIFHDCTHYSFFKSRRANRIVGTAMGVIAIFPFEKWGHDHSIHHATSGNLDKRGTGDIWTLTVSEYVAAPLKTRIAYRFYRNPLVMFGLGPIFEFVIMNRFNHKDASKKERMNTYLTNVLIVAMVGLFSWLVGWQNFLFIQGTILYIAGAAGIWLFYVQHNFEDSYFAESKEWDFVRAAVEGSSFYKLPKIMQFLTGNIGFHHVHHLSSRVPNYKLEKAHNQTPVLQNVPAVTLATSLKTLRFRLWDEKNKNFVTFKEVKALSRKKISVQVKPEL